MKRTMLKATKAKKRRALFCAALFAAALFLSACTMEPIFATIENEIPLRDPNLEGVVPSLVQYSIGSDHYLFACNGYVKRKLGSASPGDWETVNLPGGLRCGKLVAATNSYGYSIGLFALAQTGDNDWSFIGIYQYDDNNGWDGPISLPSGWNPKQVQIGPSTNGFYAVGYFGSGSETNAADYYEVYEYTGASGNPWEEISNGGDLLESPIGFGGDYIVSKRRPYKVDNGSIAQMSTSESNVYVSGNQILPGGDYDIMGMCIDPTGANLYVLTDDYLWRYDGSAWNRTSIGTSVYDGFGAPAYWDNPSGGNDLVLMPLEEGYREAIINSSTGAITGSQTVGSSSPSSVATSSRSQYLSSIDDYSIDFMFTVTDSNYLPAGCSYAVYASIGHYKYSGLWGYYDSVQTVWNRE